MYTAPHQFEPLMPSDARMEPLLAKAHDLPAYVIFNDATLVGIAQRNPQTLADLHGISGIGTKKLEAYGAEVLRVIQPGTKL